MNRRARRAVLVAIVALVVVGAALAGGAWYVLGEARRAGRLVSGVLSARTGLPITVAGASVKGSRLLLSDVRVAGLPVELRVAEVEVAGGVLPLVVPAGRRVSVVAVSASVRMGVDGGGPPDGAALESLRASLRALLDWSGAFTLRVEKGELHSRDATQPFTLTGDKDSGVLTFALVLGSASRPPALRANIRATAVGGDGVSADLDLAGEPARLDALWPERLYTPPSLAGRAETQLTRGGDLTARGRLTVGDVGAAPVVIDFESHYDPARHRFGVSRYTLDWGPDLHLAGQGEMAAAQAGLALQATGRGAVDGSPVSGRGTYQVGTGAFEGEINLESVDGRRLGRRLGLDALPEAVTARRLVARIAGHAGGSRSVATLAVRANAVTTPSAPALAVDAVLDARVRLTGARPATVEQATLTLTRGGGPLAVARLSSRGVALWPLTIDARIDDLGRLGPLLPGVPTLSGWARLMGEARAGERLDFDGTLEAQLPRAQVMAGGPVALIDVRVLLPVAASDREDARPGRMTAARVAGWGIALTDFTSTARLSGPRLLLPDIHYGQYDGQGRGWLEAFLDSRPVPLRARLEGERVDLARFVREAGWQVAHITGRVHYVAAVQYEQRGGFTAAARLNSDNDGGEVSIEAIERLLESATVQAEASGVLRQTLENLRVFAYESMEGDLRVQGTAGHVDLSLRGRKRLGIFPAPVEAINFRNVPLSVLARTLGRSDP